jgi:TPR repeat protein
MECYLLAADQGNIEAQFRIGELYMRGHGVPHEHDITEEMRWYLEGEKALKWLALAAKQGHPEAQETLRKELRHRQDPHRTRSRGLSEGAVGWFLYRRGSCP